MLGTGGDAQSACVTIVGANRERLSIAVHPRLQSSNQRQRPLVLVSKFVHFENVVGTGLDAIFLGLASRAIDHWREDACVLLALGFR